MHKSVALMAVPFIITTVPAFAADADTQPAPDLLPPVTIDTGSELQRRVVPGPAIDEESEPEVVIRKRGENMVEEYRINGRLYKVKVTPSAGPAYYMVDSDGDGIMDQRFDKLGHGIETPQWVLFKW